MALVIGSVNADAGMSQAIYQVIDAQLAPPLQAAVDKAPEPQAKKMAQNALDGAREGWKKLAFAIATGVITHITTNMEICGITVTGIVPTVVTGDTEPAAPGNHQHAVNLAVAVRDEVFKQNEGTGRAR
jgi:hypothetical protein